MKKINLPMIIPVGLAAFMLNPVYAATVAANCSTSSSALTLSGCLIEENQGWKSYVIDRPTELVYPVSVTIQNGNSAQVINATGIQAADGSVVTLKKTLLTQNPVLLLDMGTLTGGQVEIGITGGSGGQLRLSYAESSNFMTKWGDTSSSSMGINDDPNPNLGLTGDKAKDARWDVIPINKVGQYTIAGNRGGHRWIRVELESIVGTVSLDYVRVRSTHYRPATTDYVGRFLSSDPTLNRIWYAGAYTFNVAGLRDPNKTNTKFIAADGAKRDRMAWLGDMGIQTGTALYTTPHAATIMRDTIDLFACQQNTDGYIPMASQIHYECGTTITPNGPTEAAAQPLLIKSGRAPEYTAWWVIAAAQYYELTGDTTYIRRWLPTMRLAMKFFADRSQNGLFVTPITYEGGVVIQWDVFSLGAGKSTHTNAVWYRALTALAKVERQAGLGEPKALQWEQQAASVKTAMRSTLWDDNVGAFILNSNDFSRNHTQDGNVESVFSGVITDQDAQRAMSFVHDRLYSQYGTLNGEVTNLYMHEKLISPYIGSTQLLAELRAYDANSAIGLMRRLWGNMINKPPYVTFWEKVSPTGEPLKNDIDYSNPFQPTLSQGLTSLAHGWSTGPVQALSAYVLGLRPTQPGYARWLIEPQLADLSWAQGQTYTPQGALISRWARGVADSSFRMTVVAPVGVMGEVAVPTLGQARNIAMDGNWVWLNGQPALGVNARVSGNYVVFANVSGNHTFAWAQ